MYIQDLLKLKKVGDKYETDKSVAETNYVFNGKEDIKKLLDEVEKVKNHLVNLIKK